jgi:hypothetical protein
VWHNRHVEQDESQRRTGGFGRRAFLKAGGLAAAGLAVPRFGLRDEQPEGQRLGRIAVSQAHLRARPDGESASLGLVYQDTVVPWLREISGRQAGRINQRWVETDQGYVWSALVQPVWNRPSAPVDSLPATSLGPGMWAEVCVPFVDVSLANPSARSPWLKNTALPRLYFSQVIWADEVRRDENGGVSYRLKERFGFGDILWADAASLRPLSAEDVAPIHPGAENKRVFVDLTYQSLSCMEGESEVFFCRISSGAKFDAQGQSTDKWSTPIGPHRIWRKLVSIHMVGGTTGGGYDLPGIGWTSLFSGDGVAIHSTFWHNNFGEPMSHGCVNARPEDAQWIFRWVEPQVPYDPGDVTVGMPGGTIVEVVER